MHEIALLGPGDEATVRRNRWDRLCAAVCITRQRDSIIVQYARRAVTTALALAYIARVALA